MKIIKGLATAGVAGCAALLLVGCAAHETKQAAPVPAPAAAPMPSGVIDQVTATETATVKAINHKTRVVTLTHSDGSEVTLTVGKEVRNLPQVKKGDLVTATYHESLAFAAKKPDQGTPGTTVAQGAARAPQGEKPGAAAAQITTVTVTIVGIDTSAGTVTVKGPRGNVVTVKARDPKNLDRVSVGDLVDVSYTEAIEITVQAGTKKHGGHKAAAKKS
ncbi:MAG TPA: hypothetical protein VGK30_05245 [Candidatus Binatia bacterium]|jgi:Cu/Ag efflux protein CusF